MKQVIPGFLFVFVCVAVFGVMTYRAAYDRGYEDAQRDGERVEVPHDSALVCNQPEKWKYPSVTMDENAEPTGEVYYSSDTICAEGAFFWPEKEYFKPGNVPPIDKYEGWLDRKEESR